MNTVIASTYDASKGFALPSTRIHGLDRLTLEDLSVIGIEVVGEPTTAGFRRCNLPEGWKPVAAAESNMQVRLVDDQGRLRAKIFYKPGSQGGGASMQMWTRYTVDLKTDGHKQWAEVYDGNKLIHTSEVGPKRVDDHGLLATTQHEYRAAEAWLDTRFPENKDPLAYWN